MKKKIPSFHDDLIKRLKNRKFAIGFLNACLQEKEEVVFLTGLKYVAEAHGGLQKLRLKLVSSEKNNELLKKAA